MIYYKQSCLSPDLASYPGSSRGGRERSGTHCVRIGWNLHSNRLCYHSDCLQVLHDVHSNRLPHIFLGSPSACACNVYQALSPPLLEGPGYEATPGHIQHAYYKINNHFSPIIGYLSFISAQQ